MDYCTTVALNPTPQVRQRATLADKVVHHDVCAPRDHVAAERSLPGQPIIAAGTRMPHDIRLHDVGMEPKSEALAHQARQRSRDRIVSVALVCVSADEHGLVLFLTIKQSAKYRYFRLVGQRIDKSDGSYGVTRLSGCVIWVRQRFPFGRQ